MEKCVVVSLSQQMLKQLTAFKHAQITMNRITTDPEICHGKPCIRGLRYPVQTVLEWLAGGMTVAEILDDYPDLESDDIYAALAYAARLAQTNRVELLAA